MRAHCVSYNLYMLLSVLDDFRLLYMYSLSCRFHKGQHIFIESKEHGQERLALGLLVLLCLMARVSILCSGVITSITQSEVSQTKFCGRSCSTDILTSLFSPSSDLGEEAARQLETSHLRLSADQREICSQTEKCIETSATLISYYVVYTSHFYH